MQITRDNYEAFLIDYLDDNLAPELRLEVEAFLLANPDIQAEFDDLSGVSLLPESLSFQGKNALKFDDELSKPTVLMLKALDNELSNNEREEFEQLLQQPEFSKEFKLLRSTVLQPDTVSFELKSDLRFPEQLSNLEEQELASATHLPKLEADYSEVFDKSLIYFPQDADLKNANYLAVAFAEGDLDGDEFRALRDKVSASIELKAAADAYSRLRLTPPHVVFDAKDSLLRKEAKVLVFSPMVKRAVSIAAVFLLGIAIWRPWEYKGGAVVEVAGVVDSTNTQESTTNHDTHDIAATAEESSLDTTIQTGTKKRTNDVKGYQKNLDQNDVAHEGNPNKKEDNEAEDAQQQQLPILQSPQDGTEIAQDNPVTQGEDIEPYLPISPSNTMTKTTSQAPLTLLAFLGDKLEERIEQSQVYSFLDKKKKEIFNTEKNEEPVRYERVKTPSQVKQKLVLWGLEFERTKRKK